MNTYIIFVHWEQPKSMLFIGWEEQGTVDADDDDDVDKKKRKRRIHNVKRMDEGKNELVRQTHIRIWSS